MSILALPEETLNEILALCLRIHPDVFFGVCRPAFYCPQSRSSHLLRVSRQWLRVGAPLLYESISIARTAHADAVAGVLQRTGALGRAVRNVRLDPRAGGLGARLCDVVRLAPNMERLSLTFYKAPRDINGLVEARLYMRGVKHLYLQRGIGEPPNSDFMSTLALTLEDFLQSAVHMYWRALTTVTFVDSNNPEFTKSMCTILQRSPSLEEVVLQSMAVPAIIRGGLFGRLADLPHLEVVRCLGKHNEAITRQLLEEYKIPPKLAEKVTFERTSLDDHLEAHPVSYRKPDCPFVFDFLVSPSTGSVRPDPRAERKEFSETLKPSTSAMSFSGSGGSPRKILPSPRIRRDRVATRK